MRRKNERKRKTLAEERFSVVKCLLINKQSYRTLSCYRAKVRPTFDC